jgi:hypothetical protein
MIADLDETLRELLKAELPVKNNEVEISFDQPRREWSARLSRPTINLFLYDVRENPMLRQHQWETVPSASNGVNLAHMKRTPFRVDCTYVLTTWASEPDDEHRLLARAMLALFRYPILPEKYLQGNMKHQPFDLQTFLAQRDRLTDPAELWSSLDNEIRPSVSYVVTLALDPWTEITAPLVRTFTMRSGQAAELPVFQRLPAGQPPNVMLLLGGTVWRKQAGGEALAGIEVAVKGTGYFTKTDPQGRFVLGYLPPGEYTLVAWIGDGKPLEKKIALPAKDGDYDLIAA